MLRELRGAVTALALVACGVLAAVSFDLGVPGQSLLQSLRFHIAAGLLGLVVLLILGGAWRRGLLFLLVFGISAAQGAAIVYRQQEARIAAHGPASKALLKLLSFNLLSENRNGEKIADFVVGSGADVVLLMEAAPVASYRDKLLAAYPYFAGCDVHSDCGTVILSRTPLEDVVVGALSPVWRNRLITATTVIGGERINLVAAHMVKPYFDDFPAEEAYTLAEAIGRLKGPLLLAGDFNAAAWSDTIDWLALRENLAPGPAYPATWPIRLGPLGVPIDNIFTRAPLVVEHVEALSDAMGSNHRGLIAGVSIGTGGPVSLESDPAPQ
ncbi:MAG: hypothetical protein JWQ89_3952 [Devosia sp.]|uniref:endonuclease/exonuclease/phosphatase family protein n=1 Tax=Devosia sp. TaxID=1871048 RepID=UPI0026080365|nr:endonuclease/exonuclease/phosphatase family protein [Devosia sp.]MDB5542225.1 hypothetical protein [Devosia sp.]